MIRIGLMGFSFSHENKGCEAITYALLDMLREMVDFKDTEIIYFSSISSPGHVPEYFGEFTFRHCHIKLKDPTFRFIRTVRSCDFIIDATFGDSFSDLYFYEPVLRDLRVKKLVTAFKKPVYILAPQTFGPFKNKKLEHLAAEVIKRADYVFSRDKLSSDYVFEISKREAFTVTDLAMSLSKDLKRAKGDLPDVERVDKGAFGVNISGLLVKGGFNRRNQFGLGIDYSRYVMGVIDILLESTPYSVHLIPHVTVADREDKVIPDSDVEACEEVLRLYDGDRRVTLAPSFETPVEAKAYISQMDGFLGARMHSVIAAVSSGVPSIAVSYSRKFQGLFEMLEYPYVLDAQRLSYSDMLFLTAKWIRELPELKRAAMRAVENGEQMTQSFKEELSRIINCKNE